MKKLILLMMLVSLLSLTGCAVLCKKTCLKACVPKDWKYVRIERSVPHKDCVYKVQETCSDRGSRCYDKFKKSAGQFGANTVVLTEDTRSWKEGSSAGGWSGQEVTTSLANFYDCPKYEIKEAAPSTPTKSTNKSDILLRVEQK